MCTNINNYVPVRLWFDDPDEEEQWGYGYNKHFTLQDQGKDDPIDTLENRIKFRINVIENNDGSMPDNIYNYDYNNEGLDSTVRGGEIFPEIGELKKLLDILRSK